MIPATRWKNLGLNEPRGQHPPLRPSMADILLHGLRSAYSTDDTIEAVLLSVEDDLTTFAALLREDMEQSDARTFLSLARRVRVAILMLRKLEDRPLDAGPRPIGPEDPLNPPGGAAEEEDDR
jgi:hypothetical protein